MVVVFDVAWSGQNNSGRILVAAATPVLYSAILMKIGVECSPSSSTHRPILDFTLAAHSPDTAVHSQPKGPGGNTAALFVYNV